MGMSVRERKVAAVRAALSEAALGLAVERGWENVRVEDIAARAGVSTRSFGNYFSSKNEALYAFSTDRPARLRQAVLDRPSGEPTWDAVVNAVMSLHDPDGRVDRDAVLRTRLAVATPLLQGEYLKSHTALESALAEGIAERIGTDVDSDLYPRLVAGVVIQTMRVTMEFWLEKESGKTLGDTLREALARIRSELTA